MGARSTDAAVAESPGESAWSDSAATSVPTALDGPFRLAEWVVDPRAGSLRQGATEVRLEPKVMAVLLCLARRAGEVVSKGELLDAVWPDTHVHEVALTRSISDLRRRLGDDARAPRLIETLPKRGYRLMPRVEAWVDREATPPSIPEGPVPVAPTLPEQSAAEVETPEQASRRSRPLLAGTLGLLALALALWLVGAWRAPDPSVLVLPLRNLSGDTEADYFSAGVTDDLVALLWRVDGLRVATPPGAPTAELGARDLQSLGRSSRTTTVVDGSVRREGERLRIVVRLVEVEEGTILWADTYDRDLHDLFEIQNEIAGHIASALAATIDLGAAGAPTERITAYDLYLRGRDRYQRFDRAGNEAAIDFYRQALALDHDFALAHAELASALALRVANYGFPRAELQAATDSAATALRLDTELPEAHKAQALVYLVEGRPTLAHAEYRRALALRPGYREALEGIATLQIQLGQWDEAGRWQLRRPPRLE